MSWQLSVILLEMSDLERRDTRGQSFPAIFPVITLVPYDPERPCLAKSHTWGRGVFLGVSHSLVPRDPYVRPPIRFDLERPDPAWGEACFNSQAGFFSNGNEAPATAA